MRQPRIKKPDARTPQPNPTFSNRLFSTANIDGVRDVSKGRSVCLYILMGKTMPPVLDPLTTIPVARARLFKKKWETAPMAGKNTNAVNEGDRERE